MPRYGGLIIAIVLAAIAAIVFMRMSGGSSTPQQVQAQTAEIKTTNIYVAAKPITLGTLVTPELIAVQPWPQNLMLPGFIKSDDGPGPVVGTVARGSFQQNEPLLATKLANPNDPSFLAGDLPKGMRVVTIPVNEVDGVAGFVFPGDRVDVIFTHDVEKWESPPVMSNNADGPAPAVKTKHTVNETLLTNVKVLAVDQRASGSNSTDDKGRLIIPKSASLMVSQMDAQRVRLAAKTGTVSIILRALADKDSSDPLIVAAEKDVSQGKAKENEAPSGVDNIRILRGAPRIAKESAAASVSRGAPNTAVTNQPIALPAGGGGTIVNPGLVAVP